MLVLQEILTWSYDRPLWQRDALRRLSVQGALDDPDVRELTEICKGGHGLAEAQEAAPLDKQHGPDRAEGPPVSLASIHHHRGVNALAEEQTLNFAPGLTVVYGDNGAGKSGYIRILKGVCHARGPEETLGNVVSGSAPFSLCRGDQVPSGRRAGASRVDRRVGRRTNFSRERIRHSRRRRLADRKDQCHVSPLRP